MERKKGMERKKKTRRRSTPKPRARKPTRARPRPADEASPAPAPDEALQTLELDLVEEPAVALATPEPGFAARVPPPTPEPPLPVVRRAIFYDVENASQPGHIAQVIGHLAIDRLGWRTDFVAVGNWRVIGADTARLLARHGAQLVHSAPSTGVRDWSDLRIAVSAGAWLAAARPGDTLEIVSDDRAFDAVGDVAAGLGIAFRRLSYRSLAGAPAPEPREAPEPPARRAPRGRHRRYGRRPGPGSVEPRRVEPAPPRRHEPAPTPAPEGPAHTAPHDELIHIVRELVERVPSRAVLIDAVARTLKARGFARTPGSPRLVTRLRRIKEIAVSPTGMITLVGEPAPAPEPEQPEPIVTTAAEAVEEPGPPPAAPPATGQRRRRRRGRGRPRPAAVPAAG